MQYLILFLIALVGWLIDFALQAAYYLGTGPFGMDLYGEKSELYLKLGVYYSACFALLLSLPAFIAMTIRQIRCRHKAKKSGENGAKAAACASLPGWILGLQVVLISLLVITNHADHEILRFMGMRYTLEMIRTYNVLDGASDFVFGTLEADARGSYSSLMLMAIPLFFMIFILVLRKRFCGLANRLAAKVPVPGNLITAGLLYVGAAAMIISAITVYIHVDVNRGLVLRPSARQLFVSPIAVQFLEELPRYMAVDIDRNDFAHIDEDISKFQDLWLSEEPDKNWQFVSKTDPLQKTYKGECSGPIGGKQPNIVLLYLETNRAMNMPDFNPQAKQDPMPFLHTLITGENDIMKRHGLKSAWFSRFFSSGLPTVDAQMASHIGIPAHAYFTISSTFLHNKYPSFASILRKHGYSTLFIDSAADGFTKWTDWLDRWYDGKINLETKDDRILLTKIGDEILKRRKENKPFLITATSMTNHIPFDVPEGGIQPPEDTPFSERINYTMRYVDTQISDFFRRMDENNAFSDTVFFILADHGYSVSDIPSDRFIGENYNALRYNVVWIPLIMISSLDGMPAGEYKNASSQVDLAPTILSLAGICDDNSFAGHSLLNSSPHHLLINKDNNFLWMDNEYTSIFVNRARAQLFRTEDRIQNEDIWESNPEIVEKMENQGRSYRNVIDYAYEFDHIPEMPE